MNVKINECHYCHKNIELGKEKVVWLTDFDAVSACISCYVKKETRDKYEIQKNKLHK